LIVRMVPPARLPLLGSTLVTSENRIMMVSAELLLLLVQIHLYRSKTTRGHSKTVSLLQRINFFMGLRWHSRQSKLLPPLRSLVRFSLWTYVRTHVKRVNQRSAESRGFPPAGAPDSYSQVWMYTHWE
jgi:hypothetical protein